MGHGAACRCGKRGAVGAVAVEADHIAAFSGAAGGVVCASCEGGGFPLTEEAHRFMVEALARPLSDAPDAGRGVTAQTDRAITETLEHHAHVRLRAVA